MEIYLTSPVLSISFSVSTTTTYNKISMRTLSTRLLNRRIFATIPTSTSPYRSAVTRMSSTASSTTPVEDAMRDKVSPTHATSYSRLKLTRYDHSSSQHSHPQPSRSATTHISTPTMRRCKVVHPRKPISSSSLSLFLRIARTRTPVHTFLSSVTIVSDAFQSKPQPARHRMVYSLFKEEMAREGGIHALQLRTRTPEEERKQADREAQN